MSKKSNRKVTIDGREFDFDSLRDETQANLNRLRIADQRIAQLQADLFMTQTARSVFVKAINAGLPPKEEKE